MDVVEMQEKLMLNTSFTSKDFFHADGGGKKGGRKDIKKKKITKWEDQGQERVVARGSQNLR